MFGLRKGKESQGALAEDESAIRVTLVEALARRIGKDGRSTPVIEGGLELVTSGLIDSLDLVEVIEEIESASHWRFLAERIDFAGGLTVNALLACFRRP